MSFIESLKRSFKRRKRNAKYFFQWLFNEKLHGLDFTMSNYRVEGTKKYIDNYYHGYAKTPEEVVNSMLDSIEITPEVCFIDVGCGKRVTLREAAKRNFKRVEVFNCNAVDFDRYNESRGFIFDNLKDYLPGEEIYNFDDLRQFFQNVADDTDLTSEKRKKLLKIMHSHYDGNSSKRIAEILKL